MVRVLLGETNSGIIARTGSFARSSMVSLPCLAIDSGSFDCLAIIMNSSVTSPVQHVPIPINFPNNNIFKYECTSPLGFLLKDHLMEERTEHMMTLLLEKGADVDADDSGTMMPPIVGLALADWEPGVCLQKHTQRKFRILHKLLRNECDIDYSSTMRECHVHIPDAVLSLCLFGDLIRSKSFLHALAVSCVSCNINHLLHWLHYHHVDIFGIVRTVLGEFVTPTNLPTNSLLVTEVPPLQAICRTLVREMLWDKFHSSYRVMEVMDSIGIPMPVQRREEKECGGGLTRNVRQRAPETLQQLWVMLHKEWERIPQESMSQIIASMAER